MRVHLVSHSVRLVFLLTALGISGTHGSTQATSLATEQTQESSHTQVSSDQGSFTSEPPTTSQGFQQKQTEEPNLPFRKDNITLSESSAKDPWVKNIILESPTELEMLCSLVVTSEMTMETMDVVWKRGNKTILKDSISRNDSKTSWCTRHTVHVKTREDMGDYTCVYKIKTEISATFHVHVPKIHIKSNKIISYVGDHVVLACSVGNEHNKHNPISWNWYTKNGSEQNQIVGNGTQRPEKYSIMQEHANSTKLKIYHLAENDSGSYWCEAVFPLGASSGDVFLNVLTYMTPLKPFLAIAAEVIFFVAIIFVYEVCSKKKEIKDDETEKEFEQTETLKTEDSNGVGNSSTRQRKV